MTRDEFENYLGSYHKGAGEYTIGEILEICSVHKYYLPRCDKDWRGLNQLLGNFTSNGQRYKKENYYLQDWFKNQNYGYPKFLNEDTNVPIDSFTEIEKKKGDLKEIYTAKVNNKIRLCLKPEGEYPYDLVSIESIEFVKIDDKHYGEG